MVWLEFTVTTFCLQMKSLAKLISRTNPPKVDQIFIHLTYGCSSSHKKHPNIIRTVNQSNCIIDWFTLLIIHNSFSQKIDQTGNQKHTNDKHYKC